MQSRHSAKPLRLSSFSSNLLSCTKMVAGEQVLWQCLEVKEGRRKGAREWQDHSVDTLLSKECPGNFKQCLTSPTIFYSGVLDIALDSHVDDCYATGSAANMMKAFSNLESKIVQKRSPIISFGHSFERVGALRVFDEEGRWVRELGYGRQKVLVLMWWQ